MIGEDFELIAILKHSRLPSSYCLTDVTLRCELDVTRNWTNETETDGAEILNHYWITATVHSQRASQRKSKAGRTLFVCMWTHCLKSARVAALLPSWTTSWARDPLYWTTLTLDSLPANWKEKHCMVTVCFGLCVLCLPACVFLCQHFCVPPILTNYIQTGRGESLERHKSKFQNHLSFTLSILRSVLAAAFPNISENSFRNIFGIILNKQHNPQRSSVGYLG